MRRRHTLVLGLLGAALVAGCLSGTPLEEAGVDAGDEVPEASDALGSYMEPVNVSTDHPGAEPVVDVAPDGTIYVEGVGFQDGAAGGRGVNKVFRSADGGATWTDVTPPGPGQEQTGDGYVSVGPDGTVYAANVFGLTFQVFRSTDKGESWTPVNVPRIPALMHRHWIEPVGDGEVHVTVEALAPDSAARLFGPDAVPSIPNPANKGMYYFRSTDGGDTWTTPTRIDPQVNFAGQSNMAVGDDGDALYVARYEEEEGPPLDYTYEEGHWYLLASEDGGDSWERREMFDLDAPLGDTIPTIRVDAQGTLYFVWAELHDGRSTVHLATSADGGETWDRTPVLEDGTARALPWIDVRSSGTLDVAAYAAEGADGPLEETDAAWGVDVGRITGADTDDPEGQVKRVTTWPAHVGNVCVKGPACEGDEDRSLLDYLWVENGPRDRPHVAFASTQEDDVSAFPVFTRGSR